MDSTLRVLYHEHGQRKDSGHFPYQSGMWNNCQHPYNTIWWIEHFTCDTWHEKTDYFWVRNIASQNAQSEHSFLGVPGFCVVLKQHIHIHISVTDPFCIIKYIGVSAHTISTNIDIVMMNGEFICTVFT